MLEQRIERFRLRVIEPARQGRHGDHERDADGKPEHGQDRATLAPQQLTPQVGEIEHTTIEAAKPGSHLRDHGCCRRRRGSRLRPVRSRWPILTRTVRAQGTSTPGVYMPNHTGSGTRNELLLQDRCPSLVVQQSAPCRARAPHAHRDHPRTLHASCLPPLRRLGSRPPRSTHSRLDLARLVGQPGLSPAAAAATVHNSRDVRDTRYIPL